MARHNRTAVDLRVTVPDPAIGLRDYMRAVEGDLVAEAFKLADGHRPTVAKLLRVSDRTLRYLIARHLRVRPRHPVAERQSQREARV